MLVSGVYRGCLKHQALGYILSWCFQSQRVGVWYIWSSSCSLFSKKSRWLYHTHYHTHTSPPHLTLTFFSYIPAGCWGLTEKVSWGWIQQAFSYPVDIVGICSWATSKPQLLPHFLAQRHPGQLKAAIAQRELSLEACYLRGQCLTGSRRLPIRKIIYSRTSTCPESAMTNNLHKDPNLCSALMWCYITSGLQCVGIYVGKGGWRARGAGWLDRNSVSQT